VGSSPVPLVASAVPEYQAGDSSSQADWTGPASSCINAEEAWLLELLVCAWQQATYTTSFQVKIAIGKPS